MITNCKHDGCVRGVRAAGYCKAHYARQRRGRDMDAPHRGDVSPEDRFWSKVDRSGDCWVWTAGKNRGGYGRFRVGGRMRRAHRVSYSWANGPIPAGLDLDHTCHVPACVNPAHLRLATNAQNGQNLLGARRDSVSGVRGVGWHKASGKWQAHAGLDWKQHYLGLFATVAEAEAVVTEWRRINMPYSLMDRRNRAKRASTVKP